MQHKKHSYLFRIRVGVLRTVGSFFVWMHAMVLIFFTAMAATLSTNAMSASHTGGVYTTSLITHISGQFSGGQVRAFERVYACNHSDYLLL